MKSKLALNEAIQIGPWRVARKHLLFVILFGLIIIAFGLIVIQSHVFNNGENEEEEEEEGGDEEGDEEWGEFGENFSGGDWVMIAIMAASGLISLLAIFACVLVKKNTPRRLSSPTPPNAPIYSVQYNGNTPKPNATPSQTSHAPQQLPIWSGQIVQQQTQPQRNSNQRQQPSRQSQQPILTIPQIVTQQPSLPPGVQPQNQAAAIAYTTNTRGKNTAGATAPQISVEHPPPYSP